MPGQAQSYSVPLNFSTLGTALLDFDCVASSPPTIEVSCGMAADDPPAKCRGAYPYRPNPRERIRSDSESDRGEFAGEGAFAAVGRIAMDRAFFDSAIEFGTHLADVFGGDFLVFRVEGGAGFAR